jgi:hypothetical protein
VPDCLITLPRSLNCFRLIWGRVLSLFLGLGSITCALSNSVALISSADTTLTEGAPTNNLGREPFFNVGTTEHLSRNRGLFRFDLTGIPPASTLLSASLILQVVHEPNNGFEPSEMDLHRMLRDWGEGYEETTVSPGLGRPATTNEATWNSPFAFTGLAWAQPGAAIGIDYAAAASDSVFVYGVADSPYVFSSTNLLTDLQIWVDNPAANFGWLLISTAEGSPFTARRFGSREEPGSEPTLEIEYAPSVHLVEARIAGSVFSFAFDAAAGKTYSVESIDHLGNPGFHWQTFTNFTPQTSFHAVITNAISGSQSFYRVRSQ